jgi:regulator of protease activity HflC (stomatin/prohibitin superfamily)
MDYYSPSEFLSGLILGVGLAALLTLLFGVYTIGPTECGVLTTFGRAKRTPRRHRHR